MATTNTGAAAPAKSARPSRSRGAAAKSAPAKAQPAKAAAAKPEPAAAVEETAPTEQAQSVNRTAYELQPHPEGNTKSYTRWVWPEGANGTGTIYADIDGTAVRVAVYK